MAATQGHRDEGCIPDRRALVRIAEGACLSVQRPGARCVSCAETCPVDAITISERRIAIASATCVGCGQCAVSCPTGAITIDAFPDFGELSEPVLECARIPERIRSSGSITIPCFGGLTELHLLNAKANGGATIIDRGQCETCAIGKSRTPWTLSAERAAVSLAAGHPGSGPVIRVIENPIANDKILPLPNAPGDGSPSLSRRALFARVVTPSKPKTPIIFDQKMTIPSSVATPALDARLDAFRVLTDASSVPAALFPMISITQSCCANGLCGRVCPTGALGVSENDTVQGLNFDPARCIACSDCVAICPTGSVSLKLAGEGSYAGRIPLHASARAACSVCEVIFTPDETGDDRCPSCRVDRSLAAFGHALMRRPRPPDLDA